MPRPVTDVLAVPGAKLYFEVRGSGPVLLLIPTGNGDCAPFGAMADVVAEHYTVVTYDRRGFSRSPMDGPIATEDRINVDVDDICRLIDHVSDRPAHVLGTCSGAVVGLAMLAQRPEPVRTMISHEPPLASVLPDAHRWIRFYDNLYDTYRRVGIDVAKDIFRDHAGLGETRPPKGAELPPDELNQLLARIRGNQTFWFEQEMRSYPAFMPDIETLKARSDQLVLACGTTSHDSFPYFASPVLAELIGMEMVTFPGGHLGHVTHPYEYAETLLRVLKGREAT